MWKSGKVWKFWKKYKFVKINRRLEKFWKFLKYLDIWKCLEDIWKFGQLKIWKKKFGNNLDKLGLSRAKLSTAGIEFCKVMLH